MTTSKKSRERKQKSPQVKKIVRILLQVLLMVAIFAALLWYVGSTVPANFKPGESTILKGVDYIYNTILTIKVEYLLLAFLMYFGINLLFTVRLRRVLSKDGVKTSFGKTLLAQYAGMLTSDVTPGRSGYILTPVYLRDQNVPTSKGLSSVLGIQTIEFLVKVIGGIGAVIFLVEVVPAQNWSHFGTLAGINVGFVLAGLGIGLMLTGALLLAAFTWSQRAISLFDRIANSRFLKRFTGGLMGKLEEYKDSAQKTHKAIPEISLLTFACWILKGFEWYFLGLALGITLNSNLGIAWLAFFLIHPLVTALAFVPITPAGAGFQEFGIVGILTFLFGIAAAPAAAFALLSRGLLIFEDLAGVPQIAKSTSSLFFSDRKSSEPTESEPPKPF
ncbi:MAG: lysylphosphatidylglycerol synthase transmembrane domain-containing protein [Candidatus Bathyarchaeia archaeon]